MLRPVSRTLFVLFWLSCLCGGEAWGQPPYLVKDIHPGDAPASSWAAYPAVTDDLLFFWADLPSTGFELWRSDGTPAGTFPLLDIWPGFNTSDPNGSDANRMVSLGDILLFGANDGSTGPELWRSDGTPEGTSLVADLTPGPWGSDPGDLTEAGGLGFFWIYGGIFSSTPRIELWRSDGTAQGTFAIDLGPEVQFAFRMTDVGGTLFFFAYDESLGHLALWQSDGHGASEISPGTSGWLFIDQMIAVDGLAFFTVWNGTEYELWKSDGTAAGTTRLRTFEPGTGAEEMTAAGGLLFFRGSDQAGRELWKSDGTAAGTVRVADLRPGPEGSNPGELTAFGSRLFFRANDGVTGHELWSSDGTAAGTVLVRDLTPGPDGSSLFDLTATDSFLFFVASLPSGSYELWRSDGTAAGTRIVEELAAGPSNLIAAERILYFSASDGLGNSLWRSDGTASGTVPLPGPPRGEGTYIPEMLDVNGTLFFRAADGYVDNCALWRSDGTEGGTVPVGQPPFTCPGGLTNVDGTLFFTGDSASLWKSDGTSVTQVVDFRNGLSSISSLEGVGGRLFFNGFDDAAGSELWTSDGTAAGTVRVADLAPGPASSRPTWLTESNGLLFFRADSGTYGTEIWRSDGTPAGTFPLRDTVAGGRSVQELTDAAGLLFFVSSDGPRYELWRTDGTRAGTFAILPRPASALTAVGRLLFFLSRDETETGLWKSDGTPEGTVRVKLLPPDSYPDALTAVGDRLFFSAFSSATGRELWVSDGTEAGTHLVTDLEPGPRGSIPLPGEIADGFGRAVFAAADSLHGLEIWVSDGTPAGTVLLRDIAEGRLSSSPELFTRSGDRLFFSADDFVHGRELWAWNRPSEAISSGSVTGAGWITSAAPSGKGHFNLKGTLGKGGAPEGSVRFRLPGLDFQSTVLRSLVVSGARAWLQADGTLNGRGGYRVLVAVVDGQAPGGGGNDRFRIWIWSGPTVAYDSEPGAPDDAVPTRGIGGGSIVIHKPKK